MFSLRSMMGTTATALALLTVSVSAQAQEDSRAVGPAKRMVALQVGGLGSEGFISESQIYPMGAVRVNWRLSRYVLAEVGTSYSRGKIEVANRTGPVATFREETSQFATATVGIQAELPLPYVRPYVGIASGLFLRLDPPGGDRFLSTTQTFPVGVRVPLTERLGARAEVRVRYDNHGGDEGTALGAETTVGMNWSF